ncbi:MAG: ABC transporter ATP-binding protein [Crenarchaeota archaeon]|nr:ABC transporter ATP-binding protein [Thermoproteota archaeon]
MPALIQVENLKKYFPVGGKLLVKQWVKAVDGVSFEIYEGETLGLVGESGCGKSTTARLLLRLEEPTDGKVLFEGKNIYKLRGRELKEFRRKANIVFQDPYTSLDPRMTVFDIIMEPIRVHKIDVGDPEQYVLKLLYEVGLNESHMYRYPHEFSGGQRQRIAIARVLALRPKFIVLDEPTSALDVSVQAQILNLLKDLQKKYNLTYLFISHNLAVVRYMSHRIAVMYLGKIVEIGDAEEIFESPLHPYTRALISLIPVPDPFQARKRKKLMIQGEPPNPINPPPGCRFHPRCPFAKDRCKKEEPKLIEYSKGHYVACWLYS